MGKEDVDDKPCEHQKDELANTQVVLGVSQLLIAAINGQAANRGEVVHLLPPSRPVRRSKCLSLKHTYVSR